MKGRNDIPEIVGVSQHKHINKKDRPEFNYREDLRNLAPVWGLVLQMVLSILLSCLTGAVVAYLLSIVAGMFEVRIEKTAEALIWWLWPAYACFFMWKYFDVRTHVEIGEGAFATMSLGGGWQLRWRRFNGEVSTFPWINVWRHNLGGNTIDVECASAFVRVDSKDPDPVQVFSEGDKPPKLIFSYIPLNPFKMVRRVAQDGPEVGFENLNDIAEAVLKEALQHPKVDLQLLMNSHKFAETLREVFQNLTDDEGELRCFRMKVGDRYEYVIDTGYGLGIYNVQAKDLGPSRAIRDEMSNKMKKLIEAKGKAAALAATTEAVKVAGADAENAMILTGDLSGEEVKIQRFTFDIPGLTGEEKVRVAEAVGKAAPAVAAIFGGGRGGDKTKGGKKPEGQSGQKPKEEPKGKDSPEGKKPRFTPRHKR